ncbi:MAG: hypothetical protein E4H05_00880 [Acidimicrobiales bacterium]|nr:MAG: hypothetical protein E4H05_00880 [Acidimicrobiales bacterium]
MRHRPLILLTALVFAMAACSSSDDAATTATDPHTTDITEATVPATSGTQANPVDVFSFADDDLCEWVTQEEVAGFIATAFDWNGSAKQNLSNPLANCEWRLIGGEEVVTGSIYAYDAPRELQTAEGEPYDFAALDVVDFSPDVRQSAAVSGHPNLSEGVVAYDYGWGTYVFWVPPRDEYLALQVPLIGGASEFWADASYFVVADQFLHELGWVD